MIKKRTKHLGKRIAAAFLAMCLGILPSIAAMPVMTVYAATSDPCPGTLTLHVVDSSVYGADRTNTNIGTSMKIDIHTQGPQAFQEYWANGLTNYDFLYCPQGLGTFVKRTIEFYDVSLMNADNKTVDGWASRGANTYGDANYYTYNQLTNVLNAPSQTAEMVGGGLSIVLSTAPGGGGIDGPTGFTEFFKEGHHYVAVESPLTDNSTSGYYPNRDTTTKGWQMQFTWTNGCNINCTYDTNVASNFANSEPLHDEIMRGGFSFNVFDKDLLRFDNQAAGELKTSRPGLVYAVYNLNSTADGRADGSVGAHSYKADGSSPGGYVIADRNNDGTISEDESKLMIPAYTENDVITAYKEYLQKCRDFTDGSGNHTKIWGDYSNNTSGKGEFIIGNNNAGKPIIPVMTLTPDENGVVKTSDIALPVGNYIILQVGSIPGYYIDEDFRPIVSIGPWYFTEGGGVSTQLAGYGRAYFGAIDNTIGATHEAARRLGVKTTTNPVAFCPTGKNTNLGGITENNFYVAENGAYFIGSGNAGAFGPKYYAGASGPAGNNYIMNSNDIRMRPIAGQSKFNAYSAIERAGTKVYLADKDDLNDAANVHAYVAKNIGAGGDYIVVPQGNGDLNGAEFILINKNNAAAKLYTTGGMLQPGDETGSGVKYKVQNNLLLIPVDDVPYGDYDLKQVTFGNGYKADADFVITGLSTRVEDNIVMHSDSPTGKYDDNDNDADGKLNRVKAHTVNDKVYITNQIKMGGELLSVKSNSVSAADKEVTISIYNISDHYVYTDFDHDTGATNSNGRETRFETYKTQFESMIKNKVMTRDKLVDIVNSWEPCDIRRVKVGQEVSVTDTLPFGTYLIVATGVPAGYDIIGDYMTVDSIDDDADRIIFATRIEDQNTIPVIETTLREVESKLDSIPIKNRVFMEDLVKVSNLQSGQEYELYGVLADMDTGDVLKQGCVSYQKFKAYSATDAPVAGTGVTGVGVDYLVTKGSQITGLDMPNGEAAFWGEEVKNYAEAIKDVTLAGYATEYLNIIARYDGFGSDDEHFNSLKTLIMGRLRFLGGQITGNDQSLDGTGSATVLFNWIDTTEMEGKNLVAFEYLCEAGRVPNEDALLAVNTGQIIAALDMTLVGIHKDLTDKDQTAYAPILDISAEARYTGLKMIDSSEDVKADVHYGNVQIGEDYSLHVWLVDEFGNEITKADIKDKKGQPVGSEIERYELIEYFKAYSTEGDMEFDFTGLDVEKYNGQRLTAYATLYRTTNAGNVPVEWWLVEKGDADSMGYDITDEEPGKNQVDVYIPLIKTVLTDKYGNKDVDFDVKVHLIDTVSYKNLVPEASYKSVLTLVNEDGVELLDDDGNPLTASVEFKATGKEQEIEIPISFNGKDVQGQNIIAYNDLYKVTKGHIALIAQEHNVKASDQTINATGDAFKVIITTVALDDTSNTHVLPAIGEASATDTVRVKNLEPSTKYVAVTELADSRTGKVITNVAPIETEFSTDTEGSAKFEVELTFNAMVFSGKKLVVYQTIYDQAMKEVIGEHNNKNDANQTLSIPSIDTVATAVDGVSKKIVPTEREVVTTYGSSSNGESKASANKEKMYQAEIMDTITYTNLIPGNVYRITTEIACREGGAGKKGGGTLGSITTEFTPSTSSGTTVTYITVDVTNYPNSKLVVFETIADIFSETEVVIHKDLTDDDQTVFIVGDEILDELGDPAGNPTNGPLDGDKSGAPGSGTNIQTGVAENYGLLFAIAGALIVCAGSVGGVYIYKKRKNSQA